MKSLQNSLLDVQPQPLQIFEKVKNLEGLWLDIQTRKINCLSDFKIALKLILKPQKNFRQTKLKN
jgi:hypothetical protein